MSGTEDFEFVHSTNSESGNRVDTGLLTLLKDEASVLPRKGDIQKFLLNRLVE